MRCTILLQTGEVEILKLIVDEVEINTKDDTNGCTALMVAIETNQHAAIKLLLDKGAADQNMSCQMAFCHSRKPCFGTTLR
jgi:ankyrin repeat protein